MSKGWTPERRKAFGEKMKAIREEKKQNAKEVKTTALPNAEADELRRHIRELTSRIDNLTAPQKQAPQVGQRGLVGTYEKYTIDPNYYPNPTERLSSEPRLQRFAFKQNYELAFEVVPVSYETIDHVRTTEPKFNIELRRIKFDEDTGEPTNGRYVICKAVFFEDPQTAIVIARDNGLAVDESNERLFLDEMRYLRMRDWLFEAFYPPKSSTKKNKKDMVIDGKLVEYFEINSESQETMPFGQLNTKL